MIKLCKPRVSRPLWGVFLGEVWKIIVVLEFNFRRKIFPKVQISIQESAMNMTNWECEWRIKPLWRVINVQIRVWKTFYKTPMGAFLGFYI